MAILSKLTGMAGPYNWLVDQFGTNAENSRKARAQRLWDFYIGDKSFIHSYVVRAMSEGGLFKQKTLQRMRFPYRNIVPKVIKRTSLAYKVPATRYIDSDQNDLYQEVLAKSNINTQAKEWNRLAKLLSTVYVHTVFRDGRIEYDLMPPHLLSVTPRKDNYLQPAEILYMAEVDGVDRLIYWNDEEQSILDKEGKNVIERRPNPYGLIPFTPCRLSSPEDHWGEGDEQLVDIQVEANILLATTMYNAIMQGHGQAIGVNLGIGDDEEIITGPDTIIQVEGARGGDNMVPPRFEFVQPSPATESTLLLIDNMLKSAAIDRGLTPDSVSIDTVAQSGAAKAIDSWELLELRADDIEALRFFEKQLFDVTRAVWNAEGEGQIAETAVFGIDFDPVLMPLSPKEDYEVKEIKYGFGLWTPVDDMIDEDEGIDEKAALQIILDNLEIKRQIDERKREAAFGNQSSGGFGPPGPQQAGDNPAQRRDEDMASADS